MTIKHMQSCRKCSDKIALKEEEVNSDNECTSELQCWLQLPLSRQE